MHHRSGEPGGLHGALGGNAPGQLLPQQQGKVGQHQRDDHGGQGAQHRAVPVHEPRQPTGQPTGEVESGEGAAQQSCQRRARPDGGQKGRGGFRQRQQLFRVAVTVLRVAFQLGGVQAEQGGLRRGKQGADEDKNQL